MKKRFYSHIIELDSIIVRLDDLGLSNEERLHLLTLIESNLDHVILDAILSELNEEEKKLFLKAVASENHDEIWKLLKKRVENIEQKIIKAAEDLKKELHQDLDEVKTK